MNSFELNKVLGAVLGTCLILLALNIGAGAIFAPEKPAKPGYDDRGQGRAARQGAGAKEQEVPIATLLAKASVEKGQATAKQCQACHTFEKGGPNRVGPNLWTHRRQRARPGRGGFNFSAAMKAKGGKWTFDELNKFLAEPARLYPRHRHDLRRSHQATSSAPTSSISCTRCRTTRCRCPRRRRRTKPNRTRRRQGQRRSQAGDAKPAAAEPGEAKRRPAPGSPAQRPRPPRRRSERAKALNMRKRPGSPGRFAVQGGHALVTADRRRRWWRTEKPT